MNLIKPTLFIAAALSCTVAFAQDGSERASQAAEKMRIAQETRFDSLNNSDTTRFANAAEKSRAEQLKKFKG